MIVSIKCWDGVCVCIHTEYATESALITELAGMRHPQGTPLSITSGVFEKLYEYMVYNHTRRPDVGSLKPLINTPVHECLCDDWYDGWFTPDMAFWIECHAASEYLCMGDVCTMIAAHIGYLANTCGSRCDVREYISGQHQDGAEMVMDIRTGDHRVMTSTQIRTYAETILRAIGH